MIWVSTTSFGQEGWDHDRGCTAWRRSLYLGQTIPSSPSELPTNHYGTGPSSPSGCRHHHPSSWSGSGPHDSHVGTVGGDPSPCQPHRTHPRTFEAEGRGSEASCPMLEMRHTRTSMLELPTTGETVKLPRPTDASKPRGPRMKEPRGGYRRASVRTPRYTPHEWQAPRRTSRLEWRLEPFTLPLANRFSRLPEMEPAGEVHPDIGGEPIAPPRRNPPWAKWARPHQAETEHAGGVRVQPHGDSYFLPGKEGSWQVCQFPVRLWVYHESPQP